MADEAHSPELELYFASLKVELRQKGLCAVIGQEDEEGNLSEISGEICCLYYDNELPADLKKMIDEHLESCYACREIYQRHCESYAEISRMIEHSSAAEDILRRANEWLIKEKTEELIGKLRKKFKKA